MTANELQNIVISLSNQCFVRYWLNFEGDHSTGQVKMAICCSDGNQTLKVEDLQKNGFEPLWRGNRLYYVIARTNEDNTPYFSVI